MRKEEAVEADGWFLERQVADFEERAVGCGFDLISITALEGRSMTVAPEFSDQDAKEAPAVKKVVRKTTKKTVAKKKTSTAPAAPAAKKAPRKVAAAAKPKGKGKGKAVTKVPAKKAAAKKTTVTKKATASKKGSSGISNELNVYGFKIGSDSELIVNEMLKGGKGRADVTARVQQKLPGKQTRNGNSKNAPSLMAGLLSRLREQGYKVEQSWRLVPPAAIARKAERAAGGGKKVVTKRK